MKHFGLFLLLSLALSCSKDLPFEEMESENVNKICVITETYSLTFIVNQDSTIIDTLPIIYDEEKRPLAYYHGPNIFDTIIYESNKPKFINKIIRHADNDENLISSVEKFYNENEKLSVEIMTQIGQIQTIIELDSISYDANQKVATRSKFIEIYQENELKSRRKKHDEKYKFNEENLIKITRDEYFSTSDSSWIISYIETLFNYTDYKNPWLGSPYPFQFKNSLSKNTPLNRETVRSDGWQISSQTNYDNGANEYNYPINGYDNYLCD